MFIGKNSIPLRAKINLTASLANTDIITQNLQLVFNNVFFPDLFAIVCDPDLLKIVRPLRNANKCGNFKMVTTILTIISDQK